jgi:glycosyltransferase involved in cell wall biosynthesis
MKILFLSRWFPYPTSNGSKLRVYNLLRGLSGHHNITLLSFADRSNIISDASALGELCTEVHTIPWREYDPQSWRARLGFLSLKPRSIVDTFSAEMATKITQLLNRCDYDLVIASQLSMAAYRPYFRKIPALFEEVEIGLTYGKVLRSSVFTERVRHAFTWFKLRRYLSHLFDSFEACTVVSEQERQLLGYNFPRHKSKISVIPNCVQINGYKNQQSILVSNQIIFSGSFRYHVNYEAMLWFVHEVYPQVLEQIPNAHLMITGDHANLSFPSAPNITLTGYVDDIKTLTASSWISIAPLLNGGGTRLKILEAMSVGTPVVSTSKGAEGLDATIGEHLLVADEPRVFAEYVVKILKDKNLHDKIAANAYKFVKEKYDWEAIMPHFLHLVEVTANNR